MSLVTIEDTTLTSIANAIREKNGTADAYKPSEMATAISNIETGGGGIYTPNYLSFYNCTLTNLDASVENLDTSNITTMKQMFNGCKYLTSLTPKFNVTNVTDMSQMFYGCTGLKTLDLSSFSSNKVTTFYNMLRNCSELTTLDISNLYTGLATSMGNMFYGCSALESVVFSSFDTTKVTSMGSMFYDCKKLTRLDLSNFYTPVLVDTTKMFYGCSSLRYLDIRNMDFSKVTTYWSDMFISVPADCEIIVADAKAKSFVLMVRSTLTNVKTVAEL